jgi:homoserine kinase type II
VQLVHNDFRAVNALHDGNRITAVSDFEEIKPDTRVADLAKAAVLPAARYRVWGPTSGNASLLGVGALPDHAAVRPVDSSSASTTSPKTSVMALSL